MLISIWMFYGTFSICSILILILFNIFNCLFLISIYFKYTILIYLTCFYYDVLAFLIVMTLGVRNRNLVSRQRFWNYETRSIYIYIYIYILSNQTISSFAGLDSIICSLHCCSVWFFMCVGPIKKCRQRSIYKLNIISSLPINPNQMKVEIVKNIEFRALSVISPAIL